MTANTRPPFGAQRTVGVLLLILVVALAALTALIGTMPAAAPASVNDRLDITIGTAATLVALAVAALDWARARVSHDPAALLRASAFAVLGVLNGLFLGAALTGTDAALGGTLDEPSQLPILAGVVARGVAAGLLVASGWLALSRHAPSFRPALTFIGPAAAVLAVLAAAALFGDWLPELAPDSALERLASEPTMPLPLWSAPVLVVLQTIIGAGFLFAAILAHRAYRRSLRAGDALLAAGLIIAAASQVHSAIHPGSFSGVVTTGDLLRLAFYGLLLVGVVAESRADLADLRAATMEVRRLADAQFAAVALEERAKLAREIHDGLAQDLWYAKLKQSRLAELVQDDGEVRQLTVDVENAIDAALAEARHAIVAMKEGSGTGTLIEALRRHVEDYSDRFALQATLTTEGEPPHLGPRAEAEVLRIVQEALTNARRHADATVVRIAVANDEMLRITVADNGRGFRPSDVTPGFGLDSMRQRARVIGAELSVESEPANGTRVELLVPTGGGGG